MTTPEIKVRLVAEGDKATIAAMRAVRAESELAARAAQTGFAKLGQSAAAALSPVNALKAALPALGLTALATGFVAVTKGVVDFQDGLGKAALRVGTTAESFSALAFGAKTADVSVEGLETGLGLLAKNIQGLKTGTGAAADSFEELGLSASDFAGKDTAEAFELVASRLNNVKDGGARAALAMDLLGKSGRQLLPLIRDLSDKGLRGLSDEAQKFGAFVTTDVSTAAEQLADNMTKLGVASQRLQRNFVAELLPGLNEITAAMVEASKEGGILKAVWVGLGGVLDQLINGSQISQASKAVEEAQALVDQTTKLIEAGQAPIPGTFGLFNIKFDEKSLETLKKNLAEQQKVLTDAQKRFAELTRAPEKAKGGGTGSEADFDAQRRIVELSKALRLDDVRSAEAAADRQREIAIAQIKQQDDVLASIKARTALQKQAFAEDMAAVDLRQRAITTAVEKEIKALTEAGKSTKDQQKVLVELNKQSLDQRLALTQAHFQKLLALQSEYVQRYKQHTDTIKALDREVADNRANREKTFADARLANLSSEQQFNERIRLAEEKNAQLRAAVLAGDLEGARKLRAEVVALAGEVARGFEGGDKNAAIRIGERLAERADELLNLAISVKKQAEKADQALVERGLKDLGPQLKAAEDQIKDFFSQRIGLIDLKFGADQAALNTLVDSLKETLGKEVFRVNVVPNLTGGTGGAPGLAAGGIIPGPVSPSPHDDIVAMMKRGEGVINVPAVRFYGGAPFIDAINSFKFPRFAEGGIVGGASAAPAGEHMTLDITMNKRHVSTVSGSREDLRRLVNAINEVSRGT